MSVRIETTNEEIGVLFENVKLKRKFQVEIGDVNFDLDIGKGLRS